MGRVPAVDSEVVSAAGAVAVLEAAVVVVREVGGWAPQASVSVPNVESGCLINREYRAWSSGARIAEPLWSAKGPSTTVRSSSGNSAPTNDSWARVP